jgi:hypothetical protein
MREAGESLARRLDTELELPSSGGVDAFPLESRRHADVGHDHLGGRLGPADQLVVVGGRPKSPGDRFRERARPRALPHQQVVVGEEHGNGWILGR